MFRIGQSGNIVLSIVVRSMLCLCILLNAETQKRKVLVFREGKVHRESIGFVLFTFSKMVSLRFCVSVFDENLIRSTKVSKVLLNSK